MARPKIEWPPWTKVSEKEMVSEDYGTSYRSTVTRTVLISVRCSLCLKFRATKFVLPERTDGQPPFHWADLVYQFQKDHALPDWLRQHDPYECWEETRKRFKVSHANLGEVFE